MIHRLSKVSFLPSEVWVNPCDPRERACWVRAMVTTGIAPIKVLHYYYLLNSQSVLDLFLVRIWKHLRVRFQLSSCSHEKGFSTEMQHLAFCCSKGYVPGVWPPFVAAVQIILHVTNPGLGYISHTFWCDHQQSYINFVKIAANH